MCTLWQGQRRRSLVQIAMLKKAVKQFAHPPRKIMDQVAGWTMRAPKRISASVASSLQVHLQGRFYVYQARESLLNKVNAAHNYNFKAGSSYPSKQN